MAETDLRDEPLKACTSFDRRSRASEIVIDNDDHLARPAQAVGPLRQGVLQARRFLMPFDLLHRRLPDVDNRQPVAMLSPDLLRHPRAGAQRHVAVPHRPSPARPWRLAAGAAPSAPVSEGLSAAVVAAASPRPSGAGARSSRDPSQRTKARNA